MKVIALLSLIIFVASCGKYETRYLYSKYDKEYQALRAFVIKECQNNSPIFKELQKANTTENWAQKFNGKIYSSIQKTKDDVTIRRYFKVHRINGEEMEIILNSSDNNEDKLIIFHRLEDGQSLIKEVAVGSCYEPEPQYTHSTLEGTTTLAFSQTRTEGSDTDYVKVKEEFNFDVNIPQILFYWSGKVTLETKTPTEKITKLHERTLTEVVENNCPIADSDICANFPNPAHIPRCEVMVTQNAGSNTTDVDLSLIEFQCSTALQK